MSERTPEEPQGFLGRRAVLAQRCVERLAVAATSGALADDATVEAIARMYVLLLRLAEDTGASELVAACDRCDRVDVGLIQYGDDSRRGRAWHLCEPCANTTDGKHHASDFSEG